MAEGGRVGNISHPSGRASDKAGEAFGISGRQAQKVMFVDEHRDLLDPADFAEWDEGRLLLFEPFEVRDQVVYQLRPSQIL